MNIPDFSNKASIGLTQRIPRGFFYMGSRFHPREQPSRQVFVPEFDITNMPVTVGQYSTFIESGAYPQKKWWSQNAHSEQVRLLGGIRDRDEKLAKPAPQTQIDPINSKNESKTG